MVQNRTLLEAETIILPQRGEGNADCCCVYNVFGGGTEENNAWENDFTSLWIKMYSEFDSWRVILEKEGEELEYSFTYKTFPNDLPSQHTRISWGNVFSQHGAGCYTLRVNYEVQGVSGSFVWGVYALLPWSLEAAAGTVRLRSYFDSQQSIEGINFRGSNVFDDFRFKGFFGEKQPNTEVDNIFNEARRLVKVKREHLYSYTLQSNALDFCHAQPLMDLHLLSENRCLVSDFNPWNFEKYRDFETIISEVNESGYTRGSSKVVINAVMNEKTQNKRSYY